MMLFKQDYQYPSKEQKTKGYRAAVMTLTLGYIRIRGGVEDKTSVNDGTDIIPFREISLFVMIDIKVVLPH